MKELHWKENAEYNCIDCFDENDKRLAYITIQPAYMDRGHLLGNVEIDGLNASDNWPNYYMDLKAATAEIERFLHWRLNKTKVDPESYQCCRAPLLDLFAEYILLTGKYLTATIEHRSDAQQDTVERNMSTIERIHAILNIGKGNTADKAEEIQNDKEQQHAE